MFSLLSPFSLWLAAALAVPLAIHFLGRQRLQKKPFPSLLLVRERFSKSMHRHRLKNILLLLIRTLLLLCLLLALANPTFNSKHALSTHPENSLALIHNGIYGVLPLEGSQQALASQRQRLQLLDSAEGTQTLKIPIIGDGTGLLEISQRFGDYGEATSRLLSELGSRPGTTQLHIPVFAWTDLESAKEILLRALKENQGLQIAFTDYGDAAAKLQPFIRSWAVPTADAPTINLIATLNPLTPSGKAEKVKVFLNDRLFQEVTPEGGRIEVTLPLASGLGTVGRLSFPLAEFGITDFHFCFPDAGEWLMAHAGTVMASLPSLGRETYFRRILHVAKAKDIPKAPVSGKKKYKVIYLANERSVDPSTYSQAVEFVKQGGRLIIGVGQASDIPMLNRFLLQPLRMGRLGNIEEASSSSPVSLDLTVLPSLGRVPTDAGRIGTVRKKFAFQPDSGTRLLLFQSSSQTTASTILAIRDFHLGQVLLWTTDIDDLNWSDLGISPITPLLHQAFQETGSAERAQNLSIASDSVLTLTLSERSLAKGDQANAGLEVRDAEGRAFTRLRQDGRRLHIGPFDHLGQYQVIINGDTSAFAVNLGSIAGKSPAPATGVDASWTTQNAQAKESFLTNFKSYSGRLALLSNKQPAVAQAGVRALWPALILASILLLLLEGLVASVFSLKRGQT